MHPEVKEYFRERGRKLAAAMLRKHGKHFVAPGPKRKPASEIKPASLKVRERRDAKRKALGVLVIP